MQILSDLLGVVGAALITYGAWDIHPDAGAIVGGAFLLAAGVSRGRAEAQSRRGQL